jgi:hypothetical protein
VSGSRAKLEDEQHPRSEYWDRFARRSHGRYVHSDDPRLGTALICPEYSHRDGRDARIFRSRLCDFLSERGVLSDSSGSETANQQAHEDR